MWEPGDTCSVCNKQRRYRYTMNGDGFLVGTFELCLCHLPCQTEEAKRLYKVCSMQGKKER